MEQNVFFNETVCFWASGILEDGSVAFFHLNLYVFLKQNCFFNESVCFFLASGILKDGSVAFFHMYLQVFLKQNCFLIRVLFFLASGILEDGFCGLFSYEFIFLKHLASGILVDFSVLFHMN